MNIMDFMSQLDSATGLARPNLFQVQITTSALAQNAQNGAADWLTEFAGVDASAVMTRLAFMCTAAELPSFQFQTDQQHIYGPKFQFPVVSQYSDLTLSFFVGDDMQEKLFFDAWMYMICEPSTNDFNYIAEYATTIDILQLDMHDNVSYLTTLVDAFPISVAAMRLDWSNNNQIHKLDVTFTYKRLEPFGDGDTSGVAVSTARAANHQALGDGQTTGTITRGSVGSNAPNQNQTSPAPTNNAGDRAQNDEGN
jgi:hypothetical protein